MPRHPDRAEPVVSSVIIVLGDFDRVCEAFSLRDTPALLAFPIFIPARLWTEFTLVRAWILGERLDDFWRDQVTNCIV